MHLVRLGEWDVANQGEDCVGNLCLPPVQDFPVTLADFTIHPDFNYDRKLIFSSSEIFLIFNIILNEMKVLHLSQSPLLPPLEGYFMVFAVSLWD